MPIRGDADWEPSSEFLLLVTLASHLALPRVAEPLGVPGRQHGAGNGVAFAGDGCAAVPPAFLCRVWLRGGRGQAGVGERQGRRWRGWLCLLGSYVGSGSRGLGTSGGVRCLRVPLELAVAEVPVRDTPEPSGFWNVACALTLLPAPLRARINARALIIKRLVVLAGPIAAAIYRAAVLPNPPTEGHTSGKWRGHDSGHVCQNGAPSNQELIEIQ